MNCVQRLQNDSSSPLGNRVEERTFESKKEEMEFGAKYSEEIRKLGILWEMNTILKCE